jgi:MGT family glycosyltransferase
LLKGRTFSINMKSLFVPFAPSLAHVSRCLAVAEAWRSRGHDAVFAIGDERAELVCQAGFETRSLPEVPGQTFRADRGWRWLTADYFSQNVAAERSILAETKPDVVIFDFRFTTATAARLAGLPSVSIVHGNAIRLACQPRETARLLLGEAGATRGTTAVLHFFLRRLFPIVFSVMMQRVARRFSPLLKEQGLPPVDSPFQLLLGDASLVADLPEFLPDDLPPQRHIVGPLMWSGWEQPAPWLNDEDTRPLIYVTLSSTVENQAVLIKIIDALRDAPYRVIVSTGNVALPPDLQLPSPIRIFPIVPGAAVMRHSRLVFHHGGHETLLQALAAGVPSLLLPMNPDQILVAQQAQALGVGHNLRRPAELPFSNTTVQQLTPTQIRQAIDRLIADQECLNVCATFKHKLETCAGADLAAQVLEEIVQPPSCAGENAPSTTLRSAQAA